MGDAQTPVRSRAFAVARRLAFSLVIIYVVYCIGLFFFQGTLIFPRHMVGMFGRAQPKPERAELLQLSTPEGQVPAWLFHADRPVPLRDVQGKRPLLVFFHGNAEAIEHCVEIAEQYESWGFAVLLPEFRGYSIAPGSPSQDALVADALAFVRLAAARPGIDASRVVFHGRSLGGGVALAVAREIAREPGGIAIPAIITDCTFLNISSFAGRFGVPSFLVRHPFRNDQALPELDAKVLLIHADQDEVVPVEQGRALATLAKNGRFVELPGTHTNFPKSWDRYWQEIEAWLDEAVPVRR